MKILENELSEQCFDGISCREKLFETNAAKKYQTASLKICIYCYIV